MGLCKCPKKKVTNLFCFEHTVNVCEHCLVANHSRCVVQSYLRWLQDSDYDPTCRLCGKNLSDESCGPCVRLVCHDVFHWSCFDAYERALPANTAPAGYSCPVCSACIFPPPNSSSPVIEALCSLLATVNWARAGLGLPMIEEKHQENQMKAPNNTSVAMSGAPPGTFTGGSNPTSFQNNSMQSVLNMDESIPYTRVVEKSDMYLGPSSSLPSNHFTDHDTDKYKRRPAMLWLSRWFNNNFSAAQRLKQKPSSRIKRYLVVSFLAVAGFITLVLVFSELGRWSTENDPLLDPLSNPNIRMRP